MYKYIGNEDPVSAMKRTSNDTPMRSFSKYLKPDIKMRRIFRLCNPPEEITIGSEGQVHGNYSLEGVFVFLRHGDRGPLSHIRNISNVNCAGDFANPENFDSDLNFHSYEYFLQNLSFSSKAPNFLPQFLGPFHGFPLVPPATGECQLAQLTPVGIAQLLKTGKVLRSAYGEKLGTSNGSFASEDIVVYSTRYRRTFQSVVAFLYSFLSPESLQRIVLRESQSLAFCFDDCACPAAEKYRRRFQLESARHFRSHPAVVKLVGDAAAVVFEMPDKALSSDPHALRDALLAYVCHGAQLPCAEPRAGAREACVRPEHVTGLLAYTEWEARQHARSGSLRRWCLLRAYGLLRDVVSHVLRLVSERRPRLVVYSGHDKTLQYLATALGLASEATAAPHYAARLVLEVYKGREQRPTSRRPEGGPAARDFYFRLLFDGLDLTDRVQFCKGSGSILVKPARKLNATHTGNLSAPVLRKMSATYLCPIESIVRFLHDDYFGSFNATNFKDACATRS
ncbi:2-phosphoxylose phosphatase 1 isoform X2 [Bacillus rossius redtenbacheri]